MYHISSPFVQNKAYFLRLIAFPDDVCSMAAEETDLLLHANFILLYIEFQMQINISLKQINITTLRYDNSTIIHVKLVRDQLY